jgi:TonB-linked SusC/RagA family outer membrane protein
MFAAIPLAFGLAPMTASAQAQRREVTGTVTRTYGQLPVVGATITEVDGNGVGQSGPDGRFRISVTAGDVRLQVRAIGYKRKEVGVPASEMTVALTLDEDPFKLEAVVVTGQATTLERQNATTSTVSVGSNDLTNAPAQSPEQALQGKVPGAVISMNSGAPGGGAQVQIRGATSILGQGQPLFVVDGVIISNDAFSAGANSVTGAGARTTAAGIGGSQDALVNRLADLNMAEIESVEVLKSAAATAIYGSRATNGVVVIHTKRGTPGTSRFNLTARTGQSRAYRLLGTRRFETVGEVLAIPYGNGESGEDVMLALYPDSQIPFTRDYEREFYDNTRPGYEVTGSYSGGTAETQFYVNLTDRDEVGTAPRTGAHLSALRTNIDQSFLEGKVKVSVGLNLTRNSLNRGLSNNDNTCTSPIYCFGYTPGVVNLDSVDAATGIYMRNPFNQGGRDVSNPFETFQYLRITDLTFRQIGNLNASWAALSTGQQQVSVTATGGFDRAQISGDLFSPGFLQYEFPTATDGFSGRSVRTEGNIFNYNFSLVGTWGYQARGGMSFTTTGGYSFETQFNRVIRTRTRGLLPGVETSATGTQLDAADNITDFRDIALFANEQVLALGDKLAVNGGVRADRSSANGDRAKMYVFPRASGSYRFTDLGAVVNEVKVRAGWGRTGNRPRYADRDSLLAPGPVIGGVATLVQAGTVGNLEIKPETLTEIEVGADVTLLKQRLRFEGTWYSRRITNLLLQPPTTPSQGLNALIVNGGELSNAGIELGLSAVAIQRRDMGLDLRASFSKNKQEIKNLPSFVARFPVGGSFGAAFGRNFISPGGRTTWIWGNVPLDANGNPLPIGVLVTNPGAVARVADTVAGDANPDFVVALNGSLRWKRVSLAVTMDWRQGGLVSNMTRTLWDEGGTSRDYEAPITKGDFQGDWDLNAPSGYTAGTYRYDSWSNGSDVRPYLDDGSYLRVRDISLSYEAPAVWVQALGGRTLRFTLQARNPFIITRYWSFDPEYNNFGATNLNRFIDLAPFPSARQFFLSVDMGW